MAVGRAVGLEAIDAHLCWRMIVPTRFCPERFVMAAFAISFAAEKLVASFCRRNIEVGAGYRLRRGEGKLVIVQGREFRGHLVIVRINGDMAEAGRRGDGEFTGIIESFVEESADAVQFENGDKRVPVGDG